MDGGCEGVVKRHRLSGELRVLRRLRPWKPRNRGATAADFIEPSHPRPTFAHVSSTTDRLTFVTGRDCHLCAHGRQVLAGLGVRVREVDVDGDEAAALAAGGVPLAFLPVLTDGARVVAYGRFSERRLRKELAL